MANGTNKGGKMRHDAKEITTYECPICGTDNTKRKSFEFRGARFCKSHRNQRVAMIIMKNLNRIKAKNAA